MRGTSPPAVAVIGAGPAGLMAAEVLAEGGARVVVYDHMPSAARKFMMAGRGGLNLTHSEGFERLLPRYGEAAMLLRPAIAAFTPADLRAWCAALGQDTFVGSSGRVFPIAMKASPLLRAWLRRLTEQGVVFAFRHRWLGWRADGAWRFATPEGEVVAAPEAAVLALGGASWPRLGSDGGWVTALSAAGIAVTPLQPANCGFRVPWSDHFRVRYAGQPLKSIALSFGDETVRGEAMIARDGMEGGAIYALSRRLRDAIAIHGEAVLHIDLRPDVAAEELRRRLAGPRGKQSMTNWLRKAGGLAPAAVGLVQETTHATARPLAQWPAEELAFFIKTVPLRLTGVAALERAISSAGGIRFDEVDAHFMLRRMPGTFVAGEMLDWEAPTGGYLLQACFATGRAAGSGAARWLAARAR